jgi:tRNA nucleotidyltransferase/poly(A) polymerase
MGEEFDWSALLDALVSALLDTGGDGWLVGGCLRDALLGLPVVDVDIALTGEAPPVAERLALQEGLAVARLGHGTIRLISRKETARRLDLTPLQGGDIATDLAHRDFTINALALPLAARGQWTALSSRQNTSMPELIDPFGGRADLLARRLVAVGPDVFRHDPGRIIRAARLQARLGLVSASGTLQLAREAAPLLATLSSDRLREEMALLLALAAATDGVELLNAVGALAVLYPGMGGDTASHAISTLRQLDLLIDATYDETLYPALREWSASEGRRTALRQMALARACDSHERVETAPRLWQQAQAALEIENEDEGFFAARLLFARAGKNEAAAVDALLVAAACVFAGDEQQRAIRAAARANALIDTYVRNRKLLIPLPLLSGSDLIALLGISPGPAIGQMLQVVRRAQLAGEITDRNGALALIRR